MIEYFEKQLKEAVPLTQEMVDNINEGRERNHSPKSDYQEGDTILYGLVRDQTPPSLIAFVLRDGNVMGTENLVFEGASSKFPIFTLVDHK